VTSRLNCVLLILMISLNAAVCSCVNENRESASSMSSENQRWTYYVFVPMINYSHGIITSLYVTTNNGTWLRVIGYNDSTHVLVYDVTGGKQTILDDFTVDRMKVHKLRLPQKGNFSLPILIKVSSDKPVAVLLTGGLYEIDGANVFYPSVDGGFSGKEFIILTAGATRISARKGWDYAVFAIEDSEVEIRDSNDKIIRTISVSANNSKRLELFYNKIYRIVSTGRIFVSSWAASSFVVCPSHVGGYRGKFFYANPYQSALSGSPILLVISQETPTQVRVYNTVTGSLIAEKKMQPREIWFINREVADIEGIQLKIESDKDIIVYAGSTIKKENMPDSPALIANAITFLTVPPNRPTTFFVPTEGYIISPKGDAKIKINQLEMKIPQGSCKPLPSGIVSITTNETVLVEIISKQPSITHFAAYIPSARCLDITYPPPSSHETTQAQKIDFTYIALAAAAMLVSVLIVFKKRRG